MNIYMSTLFVLFGVLVYMMAVDKNVSDAINLIFKLIVTKITAIFWLIRFHPQNPITNLIMKFKYEKIAADLRKELTEKQKHVIVESEN